MNTIRGAESGFVEICCILKQPFASVYSFPRTVEVLRLSLVSIMHFILGTFYPLVFFHN